MGLTLNEGLNAPCSLWITPGLALAGVAWRAAWECTKGVSSEAWGVSSWGEERRDISGLLKNTDVARLRGGPNPDEVKGDANEDDARPCVLAVIKSWRKMLLITERKNETHGKEIYKSTEKLAGTTAALIHISTFLWTGLTLLTRRQVVNSNYRVKYFCNYYHNGRSYETRSKWHPQNTMVDDFTLETGVDTLRIHTQASNPTKSWAQPFIQKLISLILNSLNAEPIPLRHKPLLFACLTQLIYKPVVLRLSKTASTEFAAFLIATLKGR